MCSKKDVHKYTTAEKTAQQLMIIMVVIIHKLKKAIKTSLGPTRHTLFHFLLRVKWNNECWVCATMIIKSSYSWYIPIDYTEESCLISLKAPPYLSLIPYNKKIKNNVSCARKWCSMLVIWKKMKKRKERMNIKTTFAFWDYVNNHKVIFKWWRWCLWWVVWLL